MRAPSASLAAFVALLVPLTLLGGCGQKGPLVLPAKTDAAATQRGVASPSSASAAAAPAAAASAPNSSSPR
jgi:predicted small lipoprotein YifL